MIGYYVAFCWISCTIMLYIFCRASDDIKQLFFLGSLGAPLTYPLATIAITILYFLIG